MDKRDKGLCFCRGEKFHPLHQCPNRYLRVMILGEDEIDDELGGLLAIEATKSRGNESLECNDIGLFGVASQGLTDYKTM